MSEEMTIKEKKVKDLQEALADYVQHGIQLCLMGASREEMDLVKDLVKGVEEELIKEGR